MKTKHTPAPWLVANRSEIVADNKHETYIAEIYDQNENWKANACLIAAAPELLQQLILMVDNCESCGGSGRFHETVEDDTPCGKCNDARAAIAKATGENQ